MAGKTGKACIHTFIHINAHEPIKRNTSSRRHDAGSGSRMAAVLFQG